MLKPAWKNFCTLQNKNDYNFKILEETWIEFSARVNGHKVNSPRLLCCRMVTKFSPKKFLV